MDSYYTLVFANEKHLKTELFSTLKNAKKYNEKYEIGDYVVTSSTTSSIINIPHNLISLFNASGKTIFLKALVEWLKEKISAWRYTGEYKKDKDGEMILDDEGNPIKLTEEYKTFRTTQSFIEDETIRNEKRQDDTFVGLAENILNDILQGNANFSSAFKSLSEKTYFDGEKQKIIKNSNNKDFYIELIDSKSLRTRVIWNEFDSENEVLISHSWGTKFSKPVYIVYGNQYNKDGTIDKTDVESKELFFKFN